MNKIVKPIFFLVLLYLTSGHFLQAQLYTPELKVKNISDGKVGIGIDNPNTKLHLYDSSLWQLRLQNPGTGGSNWYIGASKDSWSSGGNKLIFSSTGTSTDATLAIDQSTNRIGIGTPSPQYTLDVRGDIAVGNTNGYVRWRREDGSVRGHIGYKSQYEFEIRNNSGTGIISFYHNDGSGTFEKMRIHTNGNVGVGTPIPTYLFTVNGSAGKPGGGSWSTYSDSKLKTDVLAFSEGLDLINQIRPVRYRYNGKLDLPSQQQYIGIIAEELQQVAPFMVNNVQTEDGENYLTVDPSAFDYILINAVKELNAEIEALKMELSALKEKK